MITTNQAYLVVVLALICVLLFRLNRATKAPALSKETHSEVLFERPMILRSLFGCSSVLLAALLATMIPAVVNGAASYQASTGVENSMGDYVLMLSFPIVSTGLPCLLFLWMAGSYRVRLDLNGCRYQFTQGLPLMTQTKHGSTDGGAFYVTKSRAGRHQLRFRPSDHEWGYLLDTYDADEQARAQAYRLADRPGLDMERRDTVL